jgi:hypothetical protein
VSYGPVYGRQQVVPFSFDLSILVRRSVATLYSNLVTRPTGRALRLGIESQIGELGSRCVSVLDFTQVIVLDYSCADETVAKLIQRYMHADRPADVYFLARGVAEQHRDPIEAVLARHNLALVGDVADLGFALLGEVNAAERAVWSALQLAGAATPADLTRLLGRPESEVHHLLELLAQRRVVLRCEEPDCYYALSSLITAP